MDMERRFLELLRRILDVLSRYLISGWRRSNERRRAQCVAQNNPGDQAPRPHRHGLARQVRLRGLVPEPEGRMDVLNPRQAELLLGTFSSTSLICFCIV